jgi:hypothetical protein
MKKLVLAILGVGAACSACCLPFIAPVLVTAVSAVLGLSIGGVSLDDVARGLGPWIAGAALLFLSIRLVVRRRNRASCDCAASCDPGKC